MVFCRLRAAKVETVRTIAKECRLYGIHGLYLLPVSTKGKKKTEIDRWIREGYLFVKTSK